MLCFSGDVWLSGHVNQSLLLVLCASQIYFTEYVACLVMSIVFVACACASLLIEYVAEGHVLCLF